jgi:hypothetical protein
MIEAIAIFCLCACTATITWYITNERERRRRIDMIKQLRSGLYDIDKWNCVEFPEYSLCAQNIGSDLWRWQAAEEKGNPHAWPRLRGGDRVREQLRAKQPA